MAVTFEQEVGSGRTATNRSGNRTYSRLFKLRTTDQADGPYEVGSHPSLPLVGSPYPSDGAAYCIELSVANENDWQGWSVTANYSDARKIDPLNPEADEVLVSFTSEIYQQARSYDNRGYAITNSAGDHYVNPSPTADFGHLIATIQSNHQAVPVWLLDYGNTVNSADIAIAGLPIPAGTAKLQRISVSNRKIRNAVSYVSLTVEIHLHREGHLLSLLDYGFRVLDAVTGQEKQAENPEDYQEVTQTVLLDGQGKLLKKAPGTGGFSQGRPDAVFLNYGIYASRDFSLLPGVN